MTRRRRALLWLAAVTAVLLVGALIAYRVAVQRVLDSVPDTLGPRATVERVELGWRGIALRGLRVRGEPGAWPDDDELRADRVTLAIDLPSFFRGTGTRVVHSAQLEGVYLAVLRPRNGGLRLLPGLFERRAERHRNEPNRRPMRPTRIGELHVRDGVVELFDASVRQPPHKVRLEGLSADAETLNVPDFDTPGRVRLEGRVKGPQRNGRITIEAEGNPLTRDGRVKGRLEGVDMVALQPYLIRLNEGGIERGTLDMQIDARIDRNRLRAPGELVFTGLELASGDGLLATFAGIERQAVLAAMSKNGRIELDFTLEGRLDDPKFSLNENFAMRMAGGLAQALGVTIGGVAEGVGSLFKGLLGK